MPQREQLALMGESDTQMHFTSLKWGLLTFYPTKTDKWVDTCKHCLLYDNKTGKGLECLEAPCRSSSRADGKNGFFSICEMPKKISQNQ